MYMHTYIRTTYVIILLYIDLHIMLSTIYRTIKYLKPIIILFSILLLSLSLSLALGGLFSSFFLVLFVLILDCIINHDEVHVEPILVTFFLVCLNIGNRRQLKLEIVSYTLKTRTHTHTNILIQSMKYRIEF